MSKVLLIDVDSKIPNIALMKLSSFYKSLADVNLVKLNISYYPNRRHKKVIDVSEYDRVYVSTIFKGSLDYIDFIGGSNIIYGGTGHSLNKDLPLEIEKLDCDYSIYPNNKNSYGFLTRGCIRNCSFCVVPEKEGWIRQVANISDIVKHKKVYFLDNNILAFPGHKEILQELVDKKIHCQFNQGLDIRLLDGENVKLLSKLRYIGEYIFAFDNIKLEQQINRKLRLFKKHFFSAWKAKFFIYCNANQNILDVVYRVEWCKTNQVLPYLMRDINCWSSANKDFYTDLAAYCNQPNLFKKLTPIEYIIKRQPKNINRQKLFLDSYYNKGNIN